MSDIINIDSCTFHYPGTKHNVIDIALLNVKDGEHLFLHGKSGSAKSTFLNLLSGVIEPQNGIIKILGTDISTLNSSEKDRFRGDNFGVIFQQFNLIPYLSVKDNISLACSFSKHKALEVKDIDKEIDYLLDALQISHNIRDKKAMNLSVGEQQRVAVARALIGKPKIIIADEPTSALDNDVKDKFMQLLFEQINMQHSTLIFVSHDRDLSGYFESVYDFNDLNKIIK
jgi:putative ABC transport system ATP-binding protein